MRAAPLVGRAVWRGVMAGGWADGGPVHFGRRDRVPLPLLPFRCSSAEVIASPFRCPCLAARRDAVPARDETLHCFIASFGKHDRDREADGLGGQVVAPFLD